MLMTSLKGRISRLKRALRLSEFGPDKLSTCGSQFLLKHSKEGHSWQGTKGPSQNDLSVFHETFETVAADIPAATPPTMIIFIGFSFKLLDDLINQALIPLGY